MNILIVTIKDWNITNARRLKANYKGVHLITRPAELTLPRVKKIGPDFVFFPHWSWKIPKNIYQAYNCIGFHMTDLPFGRGGTPLQNLIIRGFKTTKISAFQIVEEMDAGPIYLKKDLSLLGSAEEILKRCSDVIFTQMIPMILREKITPRPQMGKIVRFKRLKPDSGDLKKVSDLKSAYDRIRMLDAPGYPKAFVRTKDSVVSFSNARLKNNKLIVQAEFEVKNER